MKVRQKIKTETPYSSTPKNSKNVDDDLLKRYVKILLAKATIGLEEISVKVGGLAF